MHISIKSEPYGINPAPKLTKRMFDWFWANFYKVQFDLFGSVQPKNQSFETIEIRINQALPWTDYHFYITINGVHIYHVRAGEWDFTKHQNPIYSACSLKPKPRKDNFYRAFGFETHINKELKS